MPRMTMLGILSVMLLCAQEASAYLHTAQGRFLQRDPIGYVDGMGLYEYVGSNSWARLDPRGTEFVNEGRVGEDTLWWFGGKAGLGRQGTGSIQSATTPVYETNNRGNGVVCAHVKKDTGIAKVVRGYTGLRSGDQGKGTVYYKGQRGYVSPTLAAGLDAHEQGHVDASAAIYSATLAVAEQQAQHYWTTEVCCCPTKDNTTTAVDVLKSRIAWDHWKNEFQRLDREANDGPGTFHGWERAQGGGASANPTGREVIGGETYDVVLRSREETEQNYKLPDYSKFVPAKPKVPPAAKACNQMKENNLR